MFATMSSDDSEMALPPPPTTESLEFQEIAMTSDLAIDVPEDDDDAADTEALLGKIQKDTTSPKGPALGLSDKPIYHLEYWQGFFAVSTSQIKTRLLRTLIPRKQAFFEEGEHPDLYGPFWIATTLVVFMAVTGNLANYLGTEKEVEWKYDFEKLTLAASMFYNMISVVPLCVWFALKRFNVNDISLVEMISLYGYSLFTYIPSSIVCVVPMEIVRWLVIALTFASSAWFIISNLWRHVQNTVPQQQPEDKKKIYITLGCVLVLHLFIAVMAKAYFFSYSV